MNFNTIRANWREILVVLVVLCLDLFLLALLQNPWVREDAFWSTVISSALFVCHAFLKFAAACAFAWFGLSMTLPEANDSIVSIIFDKWWKSLSHDWQCKAGLIAVAVLYLGASICLAS